MASNTARHLGSMPAEQASLISTAALNTGLDVFITMAMVGGRLESMADLWTTEPLGTDLTPFWNEFERLVELQEPEA